MRKSVFYITLLIAFLIGIVVEQNLDLIPNNKELTEEKEEKPSYKWDSAFSIVKIPSSIDTAIQKAYYYQSKAAQPQPLVVSLHTWSNDYTQADTISVLSLAADVNYIHPNFRGPNWTAQACCSELVISDIDDAIDFAIAKGNVDTSNIYVIGWSGGGYATLGVFMKSRHRIKQFSSWVPISDLIAWYEETKIRKMPYYENILGCIDTTFFDTNNIKARSPYYWETPLEKLKTTKLDIYAGVYDGVEGNGPVPITQSIKFYNKLLKDMGETDLSRYVSDEERLHLLEYRTPCADYGKIGNRTICLKKNSGTISLTIFTGLHEILGIPAFETLVK